VECDELYLIAGHKGQPNKVREAHRKARCRRLKGARGRGTLATEKPPIFGMIQRSGEVRIWMLVVYNKSRISPLSYRRLLLERLFLQMNTLFTVGLNNGVMSIKQ
jgi:hypothetical protein